MAHAPDDETTPQEDITDVQQDGTSDTTPDRSAADASSRNSQHRTHARRGGCASACNRATHGLRSISTGQTSSQAAPGNLAELSAQLRQEAAEITEIAAQAGRLGIAIDAAKALREGTTPEALRRLVIERASAAADARDIVAAPPSPVLPQAQESPIVAAAKRAAATGTKA